MGAGRSLFHATTFLGFPPRCAASRKEKSWLLIAEKHRDILHHYLLWSRRLGSTSKLCNQFCTSGYWNTHSFSRKTNFYNNTFGFVTKGHFLCDGSSTKYLSFFFSLCVVFILKQILVCCWVILNPFHAYEVFSFF